MNWIKVSDRLPDKNQLYLVYRNVVSTAIYYPKFKCFGGTDATHWRPLPEPPKETK